MARIVTPIDRATRDARSALRPMSGDVLSISSRTTYDPKTKRAGILTYVWLRSDANRDEILSRLSRFGEARAEGFCVALDRAA